MRLVSNMPDLCTEHSQQQARGKASFCCTSSVYLLVSLQIGRSAKWTSVRCARVVLEVLVVPFAEETAGSISATALTAVVATDLLGLCCSLACF